MESGCLVVHGRGRHDRCLGGGAGINLGSCRSMLSDLTIDESGLGGGLCKTECQREVSQKQMVVCN